MLTLSQGYPHKASWYDGDHDINLLFHARNNIIIIIYTLLASNASLWPMIWSLQSSLNTSNHDHCTTLSKDVMLLLLQRVFPCYFATIVCTPLHFMNGRIVTFRVMAYLANAYPQSFPGICRQSRRTPRYEENVRKPLSW